MGKFRKIIDKNRLPVTKKFKKGNEEKDKQWSKKMKGFVNERNLNQVNMTPIYQDT